MLNLLRVENLSVIESASVDFSDGLNIITGETGAGKSVLIGAVNLVLGSRFNRTLFRDPEKKITVEAEFTGCDIPDELREQFETDDGVIIRREIDKAGKNRIFINGRMATVEQLKELAQNFCDIHGQHEHQLLLDSATHILFVDSLVPENLKTEYLEAYEAYKTTDAAVKKIKADRENVKRQKAILDFELNEIESMRIDMETDSAIDDRIGVLSNMEKILDNSSRALNLLRDGEVNAYELITSASSALHSISSYSSVLSKASDQLAEITYTLNDIMSGIESVADGSEIDPDELNNLIERKFKLANMVKKYGGSLEAVVAYGADIKAKLDDMEFGSGSLDALEKKLEKEKAEAEKRALKLNTSRKESASTIDRRVVESLNELELKNSVFKTVFTDMQELDTLAGIRAEFYISTNPGFEPGPIQKVASGGEISRVMLAMKEVFADADRVGTLVFDEIDTGISGKTAKQVAIKLKKVAEKRQVIVITHLPVVACAGKKHFHITKSTDSELARTDITEAQGKGRLSVLAMMIAGNATEAAVRQAEEMIEDMNA